MKTMLLVALLNGCAPTIPYLTETVVGHTYWDPATSTGTITKRIIVHNPTSELTPRVLWCDGGHDELPLILQPKKDVKILMTLPAKYQISPACDLK